MAHYKFHNDCQSSVLNYEQVKRLDFVLDQTVPIHGRGNYPTLYVKLKELIRLVKHKLQQEHSIEIRDVGLNGGAASYVLAPENSHYNDFDLVFGTDLSDEDHFDVIRDVVLDCLKEFYPHEHRQQQPEPEAAPSDEREPESSSSSRTLSDHNHNKRLTTASENHSETNTNNADRRNALNDKLFTSASDAIKQQQKENDDEGGKQVARSLQQNLNQNYQMPLSSCAIKEAYVHKMVKVNDDDRWSLISLGVQQSEATCCGQASCGPSPAPPAQSRPARLSQHLVGNKNQFLVTIANSEGELRASSTPPPRILHEAAHYHEASKQFPNSIELKFVDRMRRKFEFSVDSFQIILDSLIQFYDYAPQSTIGSQRLPINSNQSSARAARPTSNGAAKKGHCCCPTLDCKLAGLDVNYNNFQEVYYQQQQGLGQSFGAKSCVLLNNGIGYYDQLPLEPANSSSVASSSGCSSSSSVVSSSSSSLSFCDDDHEDLHCDAETPSSAASTSSILSSTASTASLSGPTAPWTASRAAISENFYPTVIGRSEFGNFKEALYHLEKKLIATRSPEEIRGGGLLKYCNLLVKNYKPTNVYQIRTLERYMCSRFFIDFSDLSQQQAKLESYLANHFSDDPILKFDYLTILHNVVQRSTVCLMNHELRLTLNMIRDLAYKLTTRFRQLYANRM